MSDFIVNSAYITNYGSITASLSLPTSLTVEGEKYDGETEIIPKCYEEQVLETKNKVVLSNIIVREIPTYETSNNFGYTFIIGD